MAVLQEDMGHWETARDHATTAGRLYADMTDERGVAATLPTEIHCYLELGEPERALGREEFAVDVMARASTAYNQGALRRVLMSCHMLLERYSEAVAHGEAARACYIESSAPINEARVLGMLAQAYRAAGRVEDERDALLSCVAIYGQLQHKDVDDKRILKAAQDRLKDTAKAVHEVPQTSELNSTHPTHWRAGQEGGRGGRTRPESVDDPTAQHPEDLMLPVMVSAWMTVRPRCR